MKQKACLVLAIWLGALLAIAERTTAQQQREPHLHEHLSVTWQGQELGQALERLSDTRHISIWLDRRVDPQQSVQGEFRDLPLFEGLEKIAREHQLSVSQFGPVIYIGPQQSAQELDSLAQQAHGMLASSPTNLRRHWLKAAPSSWPRLSEPRGLLKEWFALSKISLLGDEKIAHDLWQSQELPPLTLVDRTVLLLIGFDLTCQISRDGKRCTVVPIERPLTKVSRKSPKSTFLKQPSQPAGQQVFTLKLQNQPLGMVLDQLAKQLQLKVSWDKELRTSADVFRKGLVSCDVRNVDFDKLLESILQQADLRCWRDGQRITIEKNEEKAPL